MLPSGRVSTGKTIMEVIGERRVFLHILCNVSDVVVSTAWRNCHGLCGQKESNDNQENLNPEKLMTANAAKFRSANAREIERDNAVRKECKKLPVSQD